MCKHEEKHCPRCKILFECKVGNITQCQCSEISMNIDEQQYIFKQYNDCLCLNCIVALCKEYNNQKFISNIKNSLGQ